MLAPDVVVVNVGRGERCGLDAASARHAAALLRRGAGQLWLATRIPQVAEAFAPEEIVRLSWRSNGRRTKHYGRNQPRRESGPQHVT